MAISTEQQLTSNGAFGSCEPVEAFLKAGPKPVYCGWGSMTCNTPEYMVELVVRALMISEQRGVVLSGWAGLSFNLLKKATQDQKLWTYAANNILFVDKAPHEWLFPRVSCTVHHGGAGTVATSLRSGVPTIITPIFLDQFDHAQLLNDMGVGIGMNKQLQKITAQELGDAIKKVVSDPGMATAAAEAGHGLSQENGTREVIVQIEKYWNEWVLSGKHQAFVNQRLSAKKDTVCGACLAGAKKMQIEVASDA